MLYFVLPQRFSSCTPDSSASVIGYGGGVLPIGGAGSGPHPGSDASRFSFSQILMALSPDPEKMRYSSGSIGPYISDMFRELQEHGRLSRFGRRATVTAEHRSRLIILYTHTIITLVIARWIEQSRKTIPRVPHLCPILDRSLTVF